jgi:hypothetical protein
MTGIKLPNQPNKRKWNRNYEERVLTILVRPCPEYGFQYHHPKSSYSLNSQLIHYDPLLINIVHAKSNTGIGFEVKDYDY